MTFIVHVQHLSILQEPEIEIKIFLTTVLYGYSSSELYVEQSYKVCLNAMLGISHMAADFRHTTLNCTCPLFLNKSCIFSEMVLQIPSLYNCDFV